MFLRVSPQIGSFRFAQKEKLSPRYVKQLEVLEKVELVSYLAALPPSPLCIRNLFHVSLVRKFISNP